MNRSERVDGPIVERYVSVAVGPREFSTQYLTAGTDGGLPLLLLHGLADNAYSWRWVMPALAKDHPVYAPSLPGFGRTAKPDNDYTPEFFTAFVAAFLDTLGLEQVAVAGNSLGGLIALHLALAHPERVRALILIDSAGLGRYVSWALRLMTLPGMGVLARGYRTARGAKLWVATMVSLLAAHPERVPSEWREELYEMARLPGYLEATVATARSELSLQGQHSQEILLDRLPSLDPPILLLWGERDRVMPVEQSQAASERIRQGRTVILPDCGHIPQIEHPDRVVALVTEFLDDFVSRESRLRSQLLKD
jgi:4,5:9,10-diseco-3-hydroxy-5,9,17-trioxoandrosta-1(10),2-diene-4-oate hydrolase